MLNVSQVLLERTWEKLQALHWLSLLDRSDLFVCDLRCYYICVCTGGEGGGKVRGCILFLQEQHFTRSEFFESLAISGHWDQHEFLRGPVSCSGHAFVCHLRAQCDCDVDVRHLLLPRISYQL